MVNELDRIWESFLASSLSTSKQQLDSFGPWDPRAKFVSSLQKLLRASDADQDDEEEEGEEERKVALQAEQAVQYAKELCAKWAKIAPHTFQLKEIPSWTKGNRTNSFEKKARKNLENYSFPLKRYCCGACDPFGEVWSIERSLSYLRVCEILQWPVSCFSFL